MDPFTKHGGGVTPFGAVGDRRRLHRRAPAIWPRCVDYLAAGRDLFAAELARSLPAAHLFPLEGTYLSWLDLRGCPPIRRRWPSGSAVYGVDGAACGMPGFLRVNLAMPHPLLAETARRLGGWPADARCRQAGRARAISPSSKQVRSPVWQAPSV